MPMPCKACLHPDRIRLEGLIAQGASIDKLAKAHGMNSMGLRRHMKNHARKDLHAIAKAESVKSGSNLLAKIHDLSDQALEVLRQAKQAGSLDAANGAIGQSIRALELIGRITGEVPTGGNISINNALGVRMDVAQTSVQIVKDAQSIEPGEVYQRALRCARAYLALHPEEETPTLR